MASLCLPHGISYSTTYLAREGPISMVQQSLLIILHVVQNGDFFYLSLPPQEWSHGLSTSSMVFSTSMLSFYSPSQLLPSLSSVLVSPLTLTLWSSRHNNQWFIFPSDSLWCLGPVSWSRQPLVSDPLQHTAGVWHERWIRNFLTNIPLCSYL